MIMVDGNDIMKSILADMQKYDAEFKENENKVAKLEQEYVAEMRKLQTRQEQLRGLYTGLYEQYKKFANEKVENPEATATSKDAEINNDVATVVEERAEDVADTNVDTAGDLDVENGDTLTQAEIQDIKDTLNKTEKNIATSDDVPDYLK